MLLLGKMQSRAKSRSCDNYLSIKVRASYLVSVVIKLDTADYFDVTVIHTSCPVLIHACLCQCLLTSLCSLCHCAHSTGGFSCSSTQAADILAAWSIDTTFFTRAACETEDRLVLLSTIVNIMNIKVTYVLSEMPSC